jgi:hypothetical protein
MKTIIRKLDLSNLIESDFQRNLDKILKDLPNLKNLLREELRNILGYYDGLKVYVDIYSSRNRNIYYKVECYKDNDEEVEEVFSGGFSSSDIDYYIMKDQLSII